MLRSTLVIALIALVTAGSAFAHVPFRDGPRTAKQFATAMNKDGYKQVSCRYVKPHIRCTGLSLWEEHSDVYLRVNITVHKTAPKKGYAMICAPALGICARAAMRFVV